MDLQQWPEGSYEIASVCPSVSPSVLLGHLLGIVSLFFLNFGMVLETSMAFCVTKPDFLEKKKICYKNWANGPKMCQKQGFLSLLKNLVSHFYWVCSVMKIYFICCVPAQIPYLGKFIVPEIWAKIFSANQIARFFNQPYLQNKSMK